MEVGGWVMIAKINDPVSLIIVFLILEKMR
jgi:hypothetical protein